MKKYMRIFAFGALAAILMTGCALSDQHQYTEEEIAECDNWEKVEYKRWNIKDVEFDGAYDYSTKGINTVIMTDIDGIITKLKSDDAFKNMTVLGIRSQKTETGTVRTAKERTIQNKILIIPKQNLNIQDIETLKIGQDQQYIEVIIDQNAYEFQEKGCSLKIKFYNFSIDEDTQSLIYKIIAATSNQNTAEFLVYGKDADDIIRRLNTKQKEIRGPLTCELFEEYKEASDGFSNYKTEIRREFNTEHNAGFISLKCYNTENYDSDKFVNNVVISKQKDLSKYYMPITILPKSQNLDEYKNMFYYDTNSVPQLEKYVEIRDVYFLNGQRYESISNLIYFEEKEEPNIQLDQKITYGDLGKETEQEVYFRLNENDWLTSDNTLKSMQERINLFFPDFKFDMDQIETGSYNYGKEINKKPMMVDIHLYDMDENSDKEPTALSFELKANS